MITSVAVLPTADAIRLHERWLYRPESWLFWQGTRSQFRVPLPSVWGLEPIRRIAASLELTGRVCTPAPVAAFRAYEPSG
jgi:hypothetical protein